MNIEQITEAFYVTAQIDPEDIENLKMEGFDSIVCNRPDQEEADQPSAQEIAKQCKALGMSFIHLPMTAPVPDSEKAKELTQFLNGKSKTLGFCRTGRRALVLYKEATE